MTDLNEIFMFEKKLDSLPNVFESRVMVPQVDLNFFKSSTFYHRSEGRRCASVRRIKSFTFVYHRSEVNKLKYGE